MPAHPRRRLLLVVGLFACLGQAGCGNGSIQSDSLTVSCPRALLTLDQVASPGFVVQEGPHLLTSPAAASARPVNGDRPDASAEVRYFRAVRDLATSNGPIDITARATCYRDSDAASRALGTALRAASTVPGGLAISAGALGDEAHAEVRRATTAAGVPLTQITLRWRLSTVLNTMTVRGREGAFGLNEVLALGARQDENELAITTASPSSRVSAAGSSLEHPSP